MKELGEYLKEKRKENGVGLEEAAEDLNLTKDDVENIEAGNVRAFRDVLSLRNMVKEYAKYLGLDPEKVLDEFNDFLFEHTSRISLDDILEAKHKSDEEEKKVVSPYTRIRKKRFDIDNLVKLKPLFIGLVVFLLIIVVLFIYIETIRNRGTSIRDSELMGMRSEINEFA